MNFTFRRNGLYLQTTVHLDALDYDVGLLGPEERLELANTLADAIHVLLADLKIED